MESSGLGELCCTQVKVWMNCLHKREDAGGGSKQRKKTSKFLRVRFGDGSASALLDIDNLHTKSDPETTDSLER